MSTNEQEIIPAARAEERQAIIERVKKLRINDEDITDITRSAHNWRQSVNNHNAVVDNILQLIDQMTRSPEELVVEVLDDHAPIVAGYSTLSLIEARELGQAITDRLRSTGYLQEGQPPVKETP